MDYRKLVLKTSLATLAITGVVGGFLLVGGVGGGAGRVIGTGACAAVAAGLLMLVLGWLDQPKNRAAGAFAVSAIMVNLLLSLTAIWCDLLVYTRGWQWQERFFATTFLFFLHAAAATLLLRFRHRRSMRLASPTGIVCSVVSFMLVMLGVWDAVGYRNEAVIFHGVFLCFITTACVIGLGNDRRYWRWIGVIAASVCLCLAFEMRGAGIPGDPFIAWRVACMLVSLTVGYLNILMALPVSPGVAKMRAACAILGLATGTLSVVVALVYQGFDKDYDAGMAPQLWRICAALALLTSCATVALAIVHRLSLKRLRTSGDELPARATIFCPRCDRKQTVPLDDTPCAGCGMVLSFHAYDIRCPRCHYDTAGLTSPQCPECSSLLLLPHMPATLPIGVSVPVTAPASQTAG